MTWHETRQNFHLKYIHIILIIRHLTDNIKTRISFLTTYYYNRYKPSQLNAMILKWTRQGRGWATNTTKEPKLETKDDINILLYMRNDEPNNKIYNIRGTRIVIDACDDRFGRKVFKLDVIIIHSISSTLYFCIIMSSSTGNEQRF